MGSPVIFGANKTTAGLQNAFLMADGTLLKYSGLKNYISYNNFENNLTTGWSLGTIGTLTNNLPTGTPTFGSGASANLTLSTVSSGQLSGNYSLSLASSAASTAGNMLATQAYTIDTSDQAKVLSFKFSYSTPTNPSNVNFSGTSSNSWAVAVYDVTNSVWLPVNGAFALTQSTGVGVATGVFQTGATTASVRLCIYAANATAGASTMYLDDFYLGPQQVQYGAFMSDWQSYTPTGSLTTNATYTGFQRRVGDSLECEFLVSFSGVNTQGAVTINLPSGLTIDTSKITNTATDGSEMLGFGTYLRASTNNYMLSLKYNSTTSLSVRVNNASGTYDVDTAMNTNTNVPATIGTGDKIQGFYRVPIVGWSSNQILSSDSSQNVVTARASGASTSIANNSATLVINANSIFDTTASYSTSTGRYTCPVSGYYRVTGGVRFSSTSWSAGNVGELYVYKNAASSAIIDRHTVEATQTVNMWLGGDSVVQCSAGDLLDVRAYQNTGGAVTLDGSCYIYFERISGPAQLAATSTVSFSAYSSTTSASTTQCFIYTTVDYDTTNSYSTSTGKWTCPVSGYYQVFGQAYVNGGFTAFVYKNSTSYAQGTPVASASQSSCVFVLMNLLAGDVVEIRPDAAVTAQSSSSTNRISRFSIAKIGY